MLSVEIKDIDSAQVRAIKASIEALMEYVYLPFDYENPNGHISQGREKVWHDTRTLIQRRKT